MSTAVAMQKAIGQDGETTTSVTYEPRLIRLTLCYRGISGGRMDQLSADRLYQDIARVFLLKEQGTLVYENTTGSYKIECRPVGLSTPTVIAGTFMRVKIDLAADNPLWTTSRPFDYRLGSVAGGKRYPLRYPLRYGTWVTQAEILNDTNLTTPVTITVRGTADYVLITNRTSGEFIRIDNPIAGNQRMIIWTGDDPYVELVTYDGQGNEVGRDFVNYRLTLDSNYIKLRPGKNVLDLDNGVVGLLPVAVISYYKYFQGV